MAVARQPAKRLVFPFGQAGQPALDCPGAESKSRAAAQSAPAKNSGAGVYRHHQVGFHGLFAGGKGRPRDLWRTLCLDWFGEDGHWFAREPNRESRRRQRQFARHGRGVRRGRRQGWFNLPRIYADCRVAGAIQLQCGWEGLHRIGCAGGVDGHSQQLDWREVRPVCHRCSDAAFVGQ